MKRKLGILISGRGSNMQALVEGSRLPDAPYEVALVASDKPDAAGLVWATERGIPTFAQSPKGMVKADYEAATDSALRSAGVEAIALAGYMRLLSDDFVARWRGRIVNIHPSLLPAFPDKDAHTDALASGVRVSGCSIHVVDAGMDTGPILAQRRVPVFSSDTRSQLAKRVQVEEHRLYPEVIDLICSGVRFDLGN